MRKGAKLEMQPEERHWEGANRRGRFQRKKGKYETGTKKKCTENVPGLNLAIRLKNNFSGRRADKAVVGRTTVSLPFLKKLYHH